MQVTLSCPFLVDAAVQLEAEPGASALAVKAGGSGRPRNCPDGVVMTDLTFVMATVAFFLIAVAYATGCECLKGGRGDA